MSINKTFLTYAGAFLFFLILIFFSAFTQSNELIELTALIWTIIGVFITFMIIDSIFVKLFKLSEIRAVWISLALVLPFFIITGLSSSSPNAISQLIIQIIISILFLIIFIQFAKKDEQEKIRLLNLPDESNINLSDLAIISNKSEKKLKYLLTNGIISQIQSDDTDEILFNKGKVLNELNSIKEK